MTPLPLLLARDALLPADSGYAPVTDDVTSVRLFKVPDVAPPLDGEAALAPLASASPPAPSWPTAVAPATALAPGTAAGPGTADLGDWPGQFARLLTEVLAGARPVRQITPCLTERARIHVRRAAAVFGSGQRPRVLRVRTSQPSSGVVEMSVIVGVGTRIRALALRLESAALADQPARWLCTDIEAA
jgi:hypothetical protein